MSLPTLLLLESSGSLCSVALAKGQELIGEMHVEEPNSHSTHMAPLIQELMQAHDVSAKDLSAVVVNAGPGSYTGLRIGASLAKGLCFGSDVPLIAVSALRSIAEALRSQFPDRRHILAVIDARRENAYIGLYDSTLSLQGEELFTALSPQLAASIPSDTVLGGSGAFKANELMETTLAVGDVRMSAAHLLQPALQHFEQKNFEDPMLFEPNYIKSVHITTPKKNRYPFT